jgi:hypothetical protein
MNRTSNYQDILKLIALISMIIDHLGFYFFPDYLIFRVLGRYAFPIFCFFAGFNFRGNLNYKILTYGIIFYIFSILVVFWQIIEVNILISIFLGQLYLKIFEKQLRDSTKAFIHTIILACLWPVTHTIMEYGTLAIAFMIIGQVVKHSPQKTYIPAFITSYLTYLNIATSFYMIFGAKEMIASLLIVIGLFFSLTFKNYHKANKLKLAFISQYLLIIYCIHLAIILLIWRYYIFG